MTYYERHPGSPGNEEPIDKELKPGDIVPLEYYNGTTDLKLGFVVDHPLYASKQGLTEDLDRITLTRFARGNPALQGRERTYYNNGIALSRRKTPKGSRVIWKSS